MHLLEHEAFDTISRDNLIKLFSAHWEIQVLGKVLHANTVLKDFLAQAVALEFERVNVVWRNLVLGAKNLSKEYLAALDLDGLYVLHVVTLGFRWSRVAHTEGVSRGRRSHIRVQLGRAVVLALVAVLDETIQVDAQIDPLVAHNNGVGDAAVRLGADDVPGVLEEHKFLSRLSD